jgi:hypothetical protein
MALASQVLGVDMKIFHAAADFQTIKLEQSHLMGLWFRALGSWTKCRGVGLAVCFRIMQKAVVGRMTTLPCMPSLRWSHSRL